MQNKEVDSAGSMETYVVLRYAAAAIAQLEGNHGYSFQRCKRLLTRCMAMFEPAAFVAGPGSAAELTALRLYLRAFEERCAHTVRVAQSREAALDQLITLVLARSLETCTELRSARTARVAPGADSPSVNRPAWLLEGWDQDDGHAAQKDAVT